MMISTRGRYALRVMLDLAKDESGTYVPLDDIARREGMSEKYLESIIVVLSRAGLVRSARGAQGGYQLTKPPEEYTVGDILRTTEGSLAPVSCLEAGSGVCEMERTCVTLEVWQQIEEAVNQVVDHITLADLVKRYHEKAGADYVI